ncbi:galactose-1-phosphate uridylyltransferase [Candidatus Woesearchaeota archaeon]|nr:galactose-1-phosphate uridylyltransferase [Candidatus Woesearchaeota archaeon]
MELRKDYLLDRWVIISPHRAARPNDTKQRYVGDGSNCYFCPGNEHTTPPEIGRIEKDGKWVVRWFNNKYPFLAKPGNAEIKTHNEYFTFADAVGEHEVIVETEDHGKQLSDLGVADIKQILQVYFERIKVLSERNEYVVVFKNHGADAGTSLEHSHTQIGATSIIPPQVNAEVTASFHQGKCLYCEIISREKESDRRVAEGKHFVSFCPYASWYNYEVWIFPKQHMKSFLELNEEQVAELAGQLKMILGKLAELDASYNIVFHYAPKNRDLHLHVEVKPRIANWGGFELSTGIVVNQVSPEDAAKFYRGEN